MRVLRNILIPFFGLMVFMLFLDGINEDNIRLLVRITAKMALILFLIAFSASTWPKLFPGQLSTLILLNYSNWILAFGTVHFTHLLMVIGLSYFDADTIPDRWPVGVIGGGIAYVILLYMMISSMSRPVIKSSPGLKRTIHRIGSYYILLVFSTSYFTRALESNAYIPWATMVLVGFVLAIYDDVLLKRRRS